MLTLSQPAALAAPIYAPHGDAMGLGCAACLDPEHAADGMRVQVSDEVGRPGGTRPEAVGCGSVCGVAHPHRQCLGPPQTDQLQT